jgi:bacterioferritin-associated ferredoxin
MIVCVCHRVSDRDIAREVRQGCASFEALQDSLRVGTACGACHDCAASTFHEHAGSAAHKQRACAAEAHSHSARIAVIPRRESTHPVSA